MHKRIDYKWIVLSVTTIGALMASIDSTIVILALPQMMEKLHADLVHMIWVIMAYILVSTVLLLTFGRIADMFGRVRLYNLGFVIFTVGSALCGLSRTATYLVLSRLVQGAGAALMMVNSPAIITEVFPPNERGRALGINGITFAIGGIAGPLLGGLILSVADWRWVFYINVPIGIVGTVWGYLALKEKSVRARGDLFDFLGAIMFSVGLIALLLALTTGIQFSWTSAPILFLFGLFVVMLVLFLSWERRVARPVLDLSLFDNRIYSFSVLSAMLQALAMFAMNFLIVFYLQAVRGYDPLRAALLLIPFSIVSAVVGPLSGVLADRIGARAPATAGLLLQTAALVWFIFTLTPTTPYGSIVVGLVLVGFGGGLFWSPNTSAAMNGAPRERLGIASAALATLRQTGMVTSFALALAVAAGSLPREVMMELFVGNNVALGSGPMQAFVVGIRHAFVVSVVLSIAAAGMSFVRGSENRRAEVSAPTDRDVKASPASGM
ncbi:MAG TPA: MFS transporter [Spirochaetia bacterium]|nr:MFS transporter [Spirochaetia bacterium]